ncbi:MAG: hypothetical protein FD160_3826 [Caulobacteraceae bacterium]|nr:MAG: hypothetical protein FD160_3826 [Caulobacteraceae bacterium]
MRQSQKPRFSLINSDSPVSQLCAASLKILRQKFQKPPESHNPRRADRGGLSDCRNFWDSRSLESLDFPVA